MVIIGIVVVAACLVAFSNGSNDNFKGVATLFGSGTTNYRGALVWATMTTLLGSVAAVFFSARLIASFSGKGLVSDAYHSSQRLTASATNATAIQSRRVHRSLLELKRT